MYILSGLRNESDRVFTDESAKASLASFDYSYT